ncbi:MAG: hypothetical protein JST00_13410 [Deltaproteobacteria bacterium]|nr:hypothetical protein [Deltaproteobacteria bacterium]
MSLRSLLFAATFVAATLSFLACDPSDRLPARNPKCPVCPPPPDPAFQAVVVGTIGKMHMVESRYPLSRLGDVLANFNPELVLVAVRVDPFREDRFEDASFEMTYVAHLARQHGASVEPIDFFREQDLGAPPAPVEPWDAAELAKRETDVLSSPQLYTFEQANGPELLQRVLLANAANARYRNGDATGARRRGWIEQLTVSAIARHDRPKRVLAFVGVLDRATVGGALASAGYTAKAPSDVIAKSKETMIGDMPPEVLAAYKTQLDRTKDRAEKATGAERAFWEEKKQVLSVVVERRAACCVTQSALSASK